MYASRPKGVAGASSAEGVQATKDKVAEYDRKLSYLRLTEDQHRWVVEYMERAMDDARNAGYPRGVKNAEAGVA